MMSYIQDVFQVAVKLVRQDPDFCKVWNKKSLPPIYVDCGNTLFFKKEIESDPSDTQQSEDVKYEITANAPLLNFIIGVKEAGFAVQLMSDEPLRYLPLLQQELAARGKSIDFFADIQEMTIMRKQIIDKSKQGLLLIDNDVFSVPVQIKRRLFLNDPKFIEALEDFRNFDTSVLPESFKPAVLWDMAPKVLF